MAENTNRFVLDSSFVLSFLLPDENHEKVKKVFKEYSDGELQFIAPIILPFEVVNGIKSAHLSKRINQATAIYLIEDFLELEISFYEVSFKEAFSISDSNSLSIYDAAYICLSRAESLDILTLDKKMVNVSTKNFL